MSRINTGSLRRLSSPDSLFLATVGLPALLFYSTMSPFFAIDDFLLLSYARDQMNTLASWINAFTQMNDSGMYRPLTRSLYFWVCWQLFGFNPLGYYVINGIVFLATCACVCHLMHGLTRDRVIAIGSTGFFAFSVAHYSHLHWIAAFTVTFATLCIVASLLCFTRGSVIPSLIWFSLGLLSYETVIILPMLALVHEWILKRNFLGGAIRKTWPFWLTLGLYALGRFTFIGLKAQGVYSVVWSPLTWLNLAMSSALWAVAGGLSFSPKFTGPLLNVVTTSPWWLALAAALLGAFILICLVALVAFGLDLARQGIGRMQESVRMICVGIAWFLLGLAPTLPFANNFAVYALAIPLLGAPLVVAGIARGLQIRNPPRLVNLSLFVGAMSLFGVSWVIIHGPGGLQDAEGTNQLGHAAQSAYRQVAAEEEVNPGPLKITVVSSSDGEQLAAAILEGDTAADLMAPGSTVHYGDPDGTEDLVLRFDPSSLTFSSASPSSAG